MARPKKRAGAGSVPNKHTATPSRSSRGSSRMSNASSAPKASSIPGSTVPFTLQDEANFTERNPSHWSSRSWADRPATFVPGGTLSNDSSGLATSVRGWKSFADKFQPTADNSSHQQPSTGTQSPRRASPPGEDVTGDNATRLFLSMSARHRFPTKNSPPTVGSDGGSTPEPGHPHRSQDPSSSSPYLADTIGEPPDHVVRTPSPTPSLSSSVEEVVFRGRCNMTRILVDPFPDIRYTISTPPATSPRQLPKDPTERLEETSSRHAVSNPDPGRSAPNTHPDPSNAYHRAHGYSNSQALGSTHPTIGSGLVRTISRRSVPVDSSAATLTLDSYRNHGRDWVHRSKPGHGWNKPKGRVRRCRTARGLLSQDEQEAAIQDYLQNVRENGSESDAATYQLMHRDLDLLDDAANGQGHTSETHPDAVSSPSNGGDLISPVAGSPDDFARAGNNEIREERTDEHSENDEPGDARVRYDEDLARLLQTQEQVGFGSEQLMLLDGAMDESDDNMVIGRMLFGDDSDSGTAGNGLERSFPDAAREPVQRHDTSFPNATALAEAIEHDPYNGFDVMDFNRPSLRKKGKGKAPAFELSDEEIQAQLQSTWQKDRERKKRRKLEREEARALGLIGAKGKKRSPKDKFFEGMSLVEVRKELRTFLSSTVDTHALPPMDKVRRKMVHIIAGKFGIKTTSRGSGTNRHITLAKTSRTIAFDEEEFTEIARTVNWGFFRRSDKLRGSQTSIEKRSPRKGPGEAGKGKRSARNHTGVAYREGEVVGASAPEIGVENRGRSMLEKMGWTAGTALGADDNKGILQPISHVVKNTRAGLG